MLQVLDKAIGLLATVAVLGFSLMAYAITLAAACKIAHVVV